MLRPIHFAALAAVLLPTVADAQAPRPKMEADLVASGQKPLSGQQIASMLAGNTAYVLFLAPVGTSKAGATVPIFYRDARTRVTVAAAGQRLESNWWVDGDRYCAEQRIGDPGNVCYSIYGDASSSYMCRQPKGECAFLMRIVPGNPEKL